MLLSLGCAGARAMSNSKLHLQVQDAPKDCDTPCVVVPAKAGQKGDCLRYHYIHRGSFGTETLGSLQTKLKQHPPLKEKLLATNSIQVEVVTCKPAGLGFRV